MIEQMEARARLQLAESENAKARVIIAEIHHNKAVTVCARLLKSGRQILGYSYDGIRLERLTLLQLLCTETDCPHCQKTQANWRSFRGIVSPAPRTVRSSYQFSHLSEEVPVVAGERTVMARPAVFQCKTACTIRAHAPAIVRKLGWDLFDGGAYIGGGLTTHPQTQLLVPLLPTLDVAKNWLHQQATPALT